MSSQVHMLLWDRRCAHGLALKEALGLQRILKNPSESRYVAGPGKVIINWGNSRVLPHTRGSQWINHPDAVEKSVDKISTFYAMQEGGVRHVPFTVGYNEATLWLTEGSKVVVRSDPTGREGRGMSIIAPESPSLPVQRDDATLRTWVAGLLSRAVGRSQAILPRAPLYTKFVPSTREYRVHVVNGRAVNVRRKSDEDFYNVRIYPEDVANQAVAATRAVGLDFAGVDVLWDDQQAWVLETNTAPGIGGITVGLYADALKELIRERHRITL